MSNWGIKLGHESVILFFVISGYVIAYVADNNENTPSTFFLKRFARIYSVLPFVIIASVVIDYARRMGAYAPDEIYSDKWTLVHNSALTFCGFQYAWNDHLFIGKNGVLWSLACEWWYYMAFFAWRFFGAVAGVLSILFIGSALGPNVLLLAPCWLVGVACYHYRNLMRSMNLPTTLSLLFIATAAFIALCVYQPLPEIRRIAFVNTFNSSFFLNDLALSLAFALHLLCVYHLSTVPRVQDMLSNSMAKLSFVSKFAGTSFILYCLHEPFLYLIMAFAPYEKDNFLHLSLVFVGMITIVCLIGSLVEPLRRPLFKFIKSKRMTQP